MTRGQQLGSSDIPALLGCSPYLTAREVQERILSGAERPDLASRDTARGEGLERYVVALWAARHPGASIDAYDGRSAGPRPWATAQIDAWGWLTPDDDLPVIIEAKTTAKPGVYHDGVVTDWRDYRDCLPDHVMYQVAWQLLCTGAQTAYVAVLGPRITEYCEVEVQRDEAAAARLLAYVERWHDRHIVGRVEVPPATVADCAPRAPVEKRDEDADEAAAALIARMLDLRARAKQAEADAEAARLELAQVMAGRTVGLRGGGGRARWQTRAYSTTALDRERLAADWPGLRLEDYEATTEKETTFLDVRRVK